MSFSLLVALLAVLDHEDFGFVDTNGAREGRFLALIRVCQSDFQAQAGLL